MFDNPLKRLRKTLWMSALPDTIDVPPFGDTGVTLTKPIGEATVDDIAFTLQALNQQSSALYRQIEALKQLHDLARRAGAVGTAGAVAAAARVVEGA